MEITANVKHRRSKKKDLSRLSHLIQILADPPNRVLHKAFERFSRVVKESHCFPVMQNCLWSVLFFVLVNVCQCALGLWGNQTFETLTFLWLLVLFLFLRVFLLCW
jgi:hypothetical protein